jgi:DNA-binding beta-propeller fold protein YncE
MKKLLLVGLAFIASLVCSVQAQTVSQLAYFTTANTGSDAPYPESIAMDIFGNMYLPLTFGHAVMKVTPSGVVSKFADIPDEYLLGATFDPFGNLTVVAGGTGIWKVTPWGYVYKFSNITGMATINDLVHDYQGNLYVGDDTLELIWKIDLQGNNTVWSTDPLFHDGSGNYPFPEGVNGLAISPNGRTIYVTNTGEGRVIAIDMNADGSAKPGRVITSSIDLVGIDGIKSHWNGDLYIAQNTNFVNTALSNRILKVKQNGTVSVVAAGGILNFPTGLVLKPGLFWPTIFVANNGDAFFGSSPANQGVVKITLP